MTDFRSKSPQKLSPKYSLSIRKAVEADVPLLAEITERNRDGLIEDHKVVSADDLLWYAEQGWLSVLVFEVADIKLVIGGLLIDEIHPAKLHGTIHLVIDKRFTKKAFRCDAVAKAIDYAFDTYRIRKIKAMPNALQKTTLKLLRRHDFFFSNPWPNEAKVNGKIVSVIPCHLNYKRWKQNNGLLKQQDEN